jgi:ABC-type transporter MlaC component
MRSPEPAMAKFLRSLVAALLAVLALAGPAAAGEAEEAAARAVAGRLAGDAHAAMTEPGLDDAARFARVRQAVSDAFAFDVWEKFLVGDRDLTEAQRAEFRDLLPGFLTRLYADQFGRGLEAAPAIGGTRVVRSDVMVSAEIPRQAAKPLPVDYRVRSFEGRGPLVIDIMVGGVSFLVLKRDEFKGILDSKGAEGLLAFMRAHAS